MDFGCKLTYVLLGFLPGQQQQWKVVIAIAKQRRYYQMTWSEQKFENE